MMTEGLISCVRPWLNVFVVGRMVANVVILLASSCNVLFIFFLSLGLMFSFQDRGGSRFGWAIMVSGSAFLEIRCQEVISFIDRSSPDVPSVSKLPCQCSCLVMGDA